MLRPLIFIGCFITLTSWAQDSLYTRNAIGYLTSKKCYGRGYLNNGLQYAEQFLISEIRRLRRNHFLVNRLRNLLFIQ